MSILNLERKRFFAIMILLIMTISIFMPTVSLATEKDKDPAEVVTEDGSFWGDFNIGVTDNSITGVAGENTTKGLAGILTKYKTVIVGIGGIAAVTMVGVFIFHLVKLGQSAGNPQARSQSLTAIMWTGVATAGLGAVALITSLFYTSIK